MSSIFNRSFKYYSSLDTDVRRTFRRVRERLAKQSSLPGAEVPVAQPRRSPTAVTPRRLRLLGGR